MHFVFIFNRSKLIHLSPAPAPLPNVIPSVVIKEVLPEIADTVRPFTVLSISLTVKAIWPVAVSSAIV
jgi:hypothetical protein